MAVKGLRLEVCSLLARIALRLVLLRLLLSIIMVTDFAAVILFRFARFGRSGFVSTVSVAVSLIRCLGFSYVLVLR